MSTIVHIRLPIDVIRGSGRELLQNFESCENCKFFRIPPYTVYGGTFIEIHIQDTGYWTQDIGCWIVDTADRMKDAGYRCSIQDTGYRYMIQNVCVCVCEFVCACEVECV